VITAMKLGRKIKTQAKKETVAGYKISAINWQFWLNIILLFIVLEIAVVSIERARWITPQPSLTLTLILSLIVTLLLVRSRLSALISHPLVIIAGLLLTLWQAQNLLSAPGLATRFIQVISALQPWRDGATLAAGTENILFAVFLVLVTWIFGYLATWYLVRKKNAWVGASLGALVLLVNLSNLTDRYVLYLPLYLVFAALFIAHTRLLNRPYPAGFSRRGWTYIGVALLCITVLASSFAWFTPELHAPRLQTFIATHTLWEKDIGRSSINFFNNIPAKQAVSTSSSLNEQTFGGDWHQGDNINFIVDSSRPAYWRVHVYDLYTAGGWENSPASEYLLDQKVLWDENVTPSGPYVMTYKVSPGLKSDIALLAGSFVTADNPTLVQVSAGDVISVTMPRIFRPGEQYAVTSRFFAPSPADLSRATGGYPKLITDYYLQLPQSLPDDVRTLSRNLTAGVKTPYDKVLAINKYLSNLPYSGKIEAPPRGTDPVDYFLFSQKSGFCLYYASAMAVMLRSVGVPARLAVGYLPGDAGKQPGEYILRDKHYHAWPQIYFAGYGWVDFEATPGGSGSGVAIETPWVSDEAITQEPQWDIWQTYPLPEPQLPTDLNPAVNAPSAKTTGTGPFTFANALGIALLVLFGVAFAFLVLAAPVLALRAAFYRWLWHVDRENLASLAYDKMCNLAARVGLGPRPSQTPLEFAAALATEFPEQAGAFDRVARSYVESRFGHKAELGLFEEAELLKARCRAFDVLIKRLGLAGELTRVRH
jgi:transglutaminase-like putative cysteine protease